MEEEKKDSEDPVVEWIRESVFAVFRHVKENKINKKFEKYASVIDNFVRNPDTRVLVFTGDDIVVSHILPVKKSYKGKGLYFIKPKAMIVDKVSVAKQLISGEFTKDPLKHLETMLSEIFVPVIGNSRNREGWGEVASKDIMDQVHNLLAQVTIVRGQTEGETRLPLPPIDLGTPGLQTKDRIYVLESAVIMWTKQIRSVLKQDPEMLLKRGQHPTPDVEIKFWKRKASHLNSIFQQLQSEKVRKVLKFLDQSKSTYCSPFAKLCKDVFSSRVECNDNVKFLSALEGPFDELGKSADFESVPKLFKPIMLTLLLIWKHSHHYNTPPRLVVMIREICNALIEKACAYLSGEELFRLLEDEGTGPIEAVQKLKTTLKVCGMFKSTYFDFKAKSNVQCPHNAWRIQNNALFLRLDSFLERCHDILDLAQTIVQFGKLERLEIGGTKGKTLTTSVKQIFSDFKIAVAAFKAVKYDIMNVGAKDFDDDFYEFRCKIKELERRLGSIITQAFDDSATIFGKFKLLDSFQGLLDRPIIHEEIEKKQGALVTAYADDLQRVGDIFLSQRIAFDSVDTRNIHISRNMPPISGALGWIRSLIERIEYPMDRLRKIDSGILDHEDGKDVVKSFKATIAKLRQFQTKQITKLGADLEAASIEKLKETLLRREKESKMLVVNFDPALVALLREVKYFLLAGHEVPEKAMSIYQNVEMYRQYTGQLELIVNSYNNCVETLLDVERPLLASHIAELDRNLRAGLQVINWKSHGIKKFLDSCSSKTQSCSKIMHTLKTNVLSIRKTLESWGKRPLIQRKSKPYNVSDFNQEFFDNIHGIYEEIRKDGAMIHALVDKSNAILRVSKGLPDWRAYVRYISDIVVLGTRNIVVKSLSFLEQQISPTFIKKNETGPLLEIDVDLIAEKVIFNPAVQNNFVPKQLLVTSVEVICAEDFVQSVTFIQSNGKTHTLNGVFGKNEEKDASTSTKSEQNVFDLKDGELVVGVAGTFSKEYRLETIFFLTSSGRRSEIFGVSMSTDSNRRFELKAPSGKMVVGIGHNEGEDGGFGNLPELHLETCDVPEKKRGSAGIRDTVEIWIDRIMDIARLFPRLDKHDRKKFYIDEVYDTQVETLMKTIGEHCEHWSKECEMYKSAFEKYKDLWETDLQDMIDTFVKDASIETPSGQVIPDLVKFSEALKEHMATQSEIASIRTICDIGWLRVSAQPIKQALCTYTNKWIFAYTSYLSNHVVGSLQALHTFTIETEKGLEEDVDGDDPEALMRVMSVIRKVRSRIETTREMFDPLKQTVELLEDVGVDLTTLLVNNTPVADFLDASPRMWDSVVNETFIRKEAILPLQNAEAENLKERVVDFSKRLKEFRSAFKAKAPFSFHGSPSKAFVIIEEQQKLLDEFETEASTLTSLQELFELPITRHARIADTVRDIQLLRTLWSFQDTIQTRISEWETFLWSDVKTDILDEEMSKSAKEIKRFCSKNPIVKGWAIFKDIDDQCKNMSTVFPLVDDLHTPSMRERHWKALAMACGVAKLHYKSPSFCLKNILDLNLHRFVADVEDIVETANKELKIEKKLATIEAAWTSSTLEFVPFKKTGVNIVHIPDEIMENLEAHSVELQTIVGMGRFVEFFEDRVEHWQRSIGQVEMIVKMWTSVTRQWCSLESIFLDSEDIRTQLPNATREFEAINAHFRQMMKTASSMPNAMQCCKSTEIEESLRAFLLPKLEEVQKDLAAYLDEKKKIFPRFYFVSDKSLLDILSNGADVSAIVPHLGDCFGALWSVQFEHNNKRRIVSMQSKDGEIVEFDKPFDIPEGKRVEHYLNDLTVAMQNALRSRLKEANDRALGWEHDDPPRAQWALEYPAQIVLTSSLIFWTEESELALQDFENGSENSVRNYREKCSERLAALIKLVQGRLTKADRTKIMALLTMDVHSRDVISSLISSKVDSMFAFPWQKQLRYYYVPESSEVDIRITDFFSKYSFEYIGNTGRLVITPLTDRCYITLTMALRLMLGGAPAGPAGTGKTETTKDLSRALGLPVYVFNCSDQMNFVSLANIFKGLAQTGAWGCFDEFNRIPIEVLSVVATQVKSVLDAVVNFSVPSNRPMEYQELPAGQPPAVVGSFFLQGDEINLVPTTGFFITMNPGYAGRTELPENVKALFRPCAMIRPDLEPICENMLMAEGFEEAQVLAGKFVKLYKLSSELLSPQKHYDWSLRAVKSVLRVAGMLRRSDKENLTEEAILMRALRDFNTPKMPNHDIPIFKRLIEDLFPKSFETKASEDTGLREICEIACDRMGLQCDNGFKLKVEQFQGLLDVRHSVMLIGPSGCGKTTIWKTLLECWNDGYRQARDKDGRPKRHAKPIAVAKVINPKAVTSDELYGHQNLAKEWKEGVLSITMRGMSKNQKELGYAAYQQNKWIVLDGDIDAEWIESMNTVMDDNKVLTLVSNERIPLTDSMRMVFEINSLDHATPATVSRAGILYINESDIGWMPFVESWVARLSNEKQREFLPTYFSKYVDALFLTIKKSVKMKVPMRIMNQMTTVCRIIEGMLPSDESDVNVILNVFAFALLWSVGGVATQSTREAFHEAFVEIFGDLQIVEHSQIKTHEGDEEYATVFDYFYNVSTHKWEHWKTLVQPHIPSAIGSLPGETLFNSIFVDTVSAVQIKTLTSNLAGNQYPVLLVGSTGTGKTALIEQYLLQTNDNVSSVTINMNYYMKASDLQKQIESEVDRRSGSVFGPPPGNRKIFFIDDLNIPYKEKYGTQNSLSLLRQIMDNGVFYDKHDLSIAKQLTGCQFLAAMNPTAGSFTVNERVQRQFATFNCTMPTAEDLRAIFGQILSGHFATRQFDKTVAELTSSVAQATVHLYQKISEAFLPSSTRFVYNWDVRELSNIFAGLTRSSPATCSSPLSFIKLWMHENMRVYSDRMHPSDVDKFDNTLQYITKKYFDLPNDFDTELASNILFSSFESEPGSGGALAYEEVKSAESLKENILMRLDDYNGMNPPMNLVMFDDAVRHVTRIARIVSAPGGNALLIGVGGSGKQSLARLAASISDMKIIQKPTPHLSNFKELLRQCFTLAGPKNTKFALILSDGEIEDTYLSYVNSILSSGWSNGIFDPSEMESLLFAPMKRRAKAAGIPDTPADNLKFLVEQVRRNMHIILCMSPVGKTLSVRSRRFPAIINCCAIDWFHDWSHQALVSVASAKLVEVEFESKDTSENISYHMAAAHNAVKKIAAQYKDSQDRNVYVTPRGFLEFISCYKRILEKKRENVSDNIDRLESGVSKLTQTEKDVIELQLDLQTTLVKVEEKKKATEMLLEQMGKQRGEASASAERARIEREAAEKANAEAATIEKQADAELAAAKPAMERAKEAVDCLSKPSLTELRSLKSPPAAVAEVTKCVLMMVEKEFRNHKWARAKKMMSKIDVFIQKLRDYDPEVMEEKLIGKLEKIVNNPDLTSKEMKKKSLAAANLWDWVINIFTYNRIFVKVKPLMIRLEEARTVKHRAEEKLAAVEALLRKVENQLAQLQESFVCATNEKAEVEAEAAACMERLALAERLIKGLASEKSRWGQEVLSLKTSRLHLEGDCLLAAAFTSYIGGFDSFFREKLWKSEWMEDVAQREIMHSKTFQPLSMLATEAEQTAMISEGLPADPISVENGAIIVNCERWPLIIDPQLQGIKWLRRRFDGDKYNITVTQENDKNFVSLLRESVTNGNVLIIENVNEELHPALNPILTRSFHRRGRNLYVRIGEDDVEIDVKNFKMFLITKLSSPNYGPEIQAQTTLINFIATEKGLEDQLLGRVVAEERSDLETKKEELTAKFSEYKLKLIELENDLLKRLAEAPDDILSDVKLIEGLEKTKATATEITKAVEKAKETEKKINESREVYRPVAAEGSMLYFILTKMSTIDHMYRYSLGAFMRFFYKAISMADEGDDVAMRVDNLVSTLRQTIYTWVSRGLFEDHKLILLSQITFTLILRNKIEGYEMNSGHYQFLVRCPKNTSIENPIEWLPNSAWYAVQALAKFDEFTRLPVDMEEASSRFLAWFNHTSPETESLPLDWAALDKVPIMKLLVISALRPDRLMTALQNFIVKVLPDGENFVDCGSEMSSLQVVEAALQDANPTIPLYFILSPGMDVVSDLDRAAMDVGQIKGSTYHNISMGQGQDQIAEQLLELANKEGHWLILNNVHLMPEWLVVLEKMLDDFALDRFERLQRVQGVDLEDVDQDMRDEFDKRDMFRLFLTSDPSVKIPPGILNRSIKLIFEPPRGVKSNLKRAICSFSREMFDDMEKKTKAILFGLCHFHSLMMERKKFGPQGFNMMYNFSLGDLRDSAVCLSNYMEESEDVKIPWEDLRYIFGQIMYGGHIVNDFDRHLCVTYLKFIMDDDLFEEKELCPFNGDSKPVVSFVSPAPTTYDRYLSYIDNELTGDSPELFGLHPNAEIGFRTRRSGQILNVLKGMIPQVNRSADTDGAATKEATNFDDDEDDMLIRSPQLVAENTLNEILECLEVENDDAIFFAMDDIEELLGGKKGPFQNVFLQECHQMNVLIREIILSLRELEKGFAGELTMSDSMEKLQTALYEDKVPASWERLAWPSQRTLSSWITNLQDRLQQLADWASEPTGIPHCTWISGLRNPQSLLTAIMQECAHENNCELDKLAITTDVTRMDFGSVQTQSREGCYIHGLAMEGARWDRESGTIERSMPKEMFCHIPVIICKAVALNQVPSSGVYECPVYKTQQRGPTFVFKAQLKTRQPPERWVLAGVALIMDIID